MSGLEMQGICNEGPPASDVEGTTSMSASLWGASVAAAGLCAAFAFCRTCANVVS